MRTINLMAKTGTTMAATQVSPTASASAEPELAVHTSQWPEETKLRVLDELQATELRNPKKASIHD